MFNKSVLVLFIGMDIFYYNWKYSLNNYKIYFEVIFIVVVIITVIAACITEIYSKTGKYGKYDEDDRINFNKNAKGKINENNKKNINLICPLLIIIVQSKGTGLSAWGLIILIVCAILIGVGVYYVVIFYPLLCKKERKYDRIELTTV